jgi:TonB-dependent SusC/RagA subfamily outer membrane receptor
MSTTKRKEYLEFRYLLGLLLALVLVQAAFPAIAENNPVVQQTEKKISGTVQDGSTPVIGATIKVKGTNNGTITDLDGKYSLKVRVGDILVCSSVGYKNQYFEVKPGQSTYNITLEEDVEVLSEVVVVGYGVQKKSDITGAMVNVSNKSLKQAPVANVAAALQGLAAGVDIQMAGGSTHPGAVPQIRIRGERSINAGNDALIVLDGIPFSGNLNDISNEDIESISILKDASATAIYGSRGANGVILIMTKKGAKGKPKISYNGYYGVVKAINKYNVMNSEEFIRFKQWAFYNANTDKYTGPDDPEIMQINRVFKDQTEMEGYYAGNNTDCIEMKNTVNQRLLS